MQVSYPRICKEIWLPWRAGLSLGEIPCSHNEFLDLPRLQLYLRILLHDELTSRFPDWIDVLQWLVSILSHERALYSVEDPGKIWGWGTETKTLLFPSHDVQRCRSDGRKSLQGPSLVWRRTEIAAQDFLQTTNRMMLSASFRWSHSGVRLYFQPGWRCLVARKSMSHLSTVWRSFQCACWANSSSQILKNDTKRSSNRMECCTSFLPICLVCGRTWNETIKEARGKKWNAKVVKDGTGRVLSPQNCSATWRQANNVERLVAGPTCIRKRICSLSSHFVRNKPSRRLLLLVGSLWSDPRSASVTWFVSRFQWTRGLLTSASKHLPLLHWPDVFAKIWCQIVSLWNKMLWSCDQLVLTCETTSQKCLMQKKSTCTLSHTDNRQCVECSDGRGEMQVLNYTR